jgi:SnoaL-like domain
MQATEQTAAHLESLALAYLEAVGQKQFDRVSEFLHPDVEFTGPARTLNGADHYVSALRRLGPVLLRNDIRKAFVDGNEVCIIYDFVTDTQVGAVPSVEWLTFEDGKIRSIRLIFHSQPWPTVMEEATRRASQAS